MYHNRRKKVVIFIALILFVWLRWMLYPYPCLDLIINGFMPFFFAAVFFAMLFTLIEMCIFQNWDINYQPLVLQNYELSAMVDIIISIRIIMAAIFMILVIAIPLQKRVETLIWNHCNDTDILRFSLCVVCVCVCVCAIVCVYLNFLMCCAKLREFTLKLRNTVNHKNTKKKA